jgi:hypothetical protein
MTRMKITAEPHKLQSVESWIISGARGAREGYACPQQARGNQFCLYDEDLASDQGDRPLQIHRLRRFGDEAPTAHNRGARSDVAQ